MKRWAIAGILSFAAMGATGAAPPQATAAKPTSEATAPPGKDPAAQRAALDEVLRRYRNRYSGSRGTESRFDVTGRRGRYRQDPDYTRRASLSSRANRAARRAENMARAGQLTPEQLDITLSRLLPVWDVIHYSHTIDSRTWKESRSWLERVENSLKRPETIRLPSAPQTPAPPAESR